jgi:hypothetical protein
VLGFSGFSIFCLVDACVPFRSPAGGSITGRRSTEGDVWVRERLLVSELVRLLCREKPRGNRQRPQSVQVMSSTEAEREGIVIRRI